MEQTTRSLASTCSPSSRSLLVDAVSVSPPNSFSLSLSLFLSLTLSLTSNHPLTLDHTQRKKAAAAPAASLKAKKTERTKKKATGASKNSATTAVPPPPSSSSSATSSSASAASTLPARLELTCSVPGSSEAFSFVAEGALRKFHVGRVRNGRHGLCLRDDQVSSRHAVIEWVPCKGGGAAGDRGEVSLLGGAWVLHDLGSTNGTAVNGLRVEPLEPYELQHSDEVSFGLGGGGSGGSSGGEPSTCSVSLSLCERRMEVVTEGQFLEIEAGKAGDACRAGAERVAGALRARYRRHKRAMYEDSLAAWRAARGGGGGGQGGGGGGSAATRQAAVRRLRRGGLLDGGSAAA